MAYANAANPNNRIAAIGGVAAIHAGLGALLIYGLATGTFSAPDRGELTAGQIKIDPPPAPPPEPTPEPRTSSEASSRPVVAPVPPVSIATTPPRVPTSDTILPPSDPIVIPRVVPTSPPAPPAPPPSPQPGFDPVAARPANNPGGWVTQADYRSSWVSRGYAGDVAFRLGIGASGRVESCTVTRSSGVGALDEATCRLVTERARFDPAKNAQGRATGGSYVNAVRWHLPD